MMRRCDSPSQKSFKHYGGRGITVCERWKQSFLAFLADMGEAPSVQSWIERENTDGDYSPDNCKWSTPKANNNNRRNNHRLTVNGKTMTATQWAETVGLPQKTLFARIYAGWSPEKAIMTPLLHF